MLAWDPVIVVMAHGACVQNNGREFIEQSFRGLVRPENSSLHPGCSRGPPGLSRGRVQRGLIVGAWTGSTCFLLTGLAAWATSKVADTLMLAGYAGEP
jgi:hypothetical protein